MANFNKVILIGNLTRDPELRYTSKGMAIAKLGLAINRYWKDESGAAKEEATFLDVDAFGHQAETLGKYMKKGKPIMIEGRLRMDTWEDKQTNQKRSKLGVVLESFQFLDFGGRPAEEANPGAARSANAAPPPSAPPSPPAAPQSSAPADLTPEEDDVPF